MDERTGRDMISRLEIKKFGMRSWKGSPELDSLPLSLRDACASALLDFEIDRVQKVILVDLRYYI